MFSLKYLFCSNFAYKRLFCFDGVVCCQTPFYVRTYVYTCVIIPIFPLPLSFPSFLVAIEKAGRDSGSFACACKINE